MTVPKTTVFHATTGEATLDPTVPRRFWPVFLKEPAMTKRKPKRQDTNEMKAVCSLEVPEGLEHVVTARCIVCQTTREVRAFEVPEGDVPQCTRPGCFGICIAERAAIRKRK